MAKQMTASLQKPPTSSSTKRWEAEAAVELRLAGCRLLPCLSGALYVPDHEALLVADLHLEKGSSRARAGALLPPYDTRSGLMALERALDKWAPRAVLLLGDSFHDNGGPARMDAADRHHLERLARRADFTWLSGNHDSELPGCLPGRHVSESHLGGLVLRHEPQAGACNEVAGHLHPAASVVRRGRRVRAKCFVSSQYRVIMPAFGAFTGGLDVRHEVFRELLPGRSFEAVMIGSRSLHRVPGQAVLRLR
jgi:DNA ligase-associated metallophosphoesterase